MVAGKVPPARTAQGIEANSLQRGPRSGRLKRRVACQPQLHVEVGDGFQIIQKRSGNMGALTICGRRSATELEWLQTKSRRLEGRGGLKLTHCSVAQDPAG